MKRPFRPLFLCRLLLAVSLGLPLGATTVPASDSATELEELRAEVARLRAENATLRAQLQGPPVAQAAPPPAVAAAEPAPGRPAAVPAPAAAPGPDRTVPDQVVQLGSFEVQSTQDRGYLVQNAGEALKTNEDVMKVPQSVTVVTRDFLDDIASAASTDTSEVLNYAAGGSNFYSGDSASLRGLRVNIMTDDSPTNLADPVAIDSIAVVRGPAAVLYGLNASLGGLVLKTSRRPTATWQGSVLARTDSWGFHREEVDVGGPIYQGDGVGVGVRFDFADQDGYSFLHNFENRRHVYYSAVEAKFGRDTTLRVEGGIQDAYLDPNKVNFIEPNGQVYTGAGRREGYVAPGGRQYAQNTALRLAFLHRMSDDWDFRILADQAHSYIGPNGIILGSQANYQTGQVKLASRVNDQGTDGYVAQMDFHGKEQLWRFPMQSTIGVLYQEGTTNPSLFTTDPNFGLRNGQTGSLYVAPMNSPQMDKVVVADANTIWADAKVTNWGPRGTTIRTNEYVQQDLDVIPDRITLMGSVAQFNWFNESENNTALVPNQAQTVARQHALLHRYGAVLRPWDWLALYCLDSTTFLNSSSTQRDIDGNLVPPQFGEGKEVGFKVNAWNNRVTSTVALFDIKLTNQAVLDPLPSPITGTTFYDLLGVTEQRGWDWTGTFEPVTNLQLILNTYRGTVTTQTGAGVPNSYSGMWSAFAHYSFAAHSPLAGLSLGAGANRQMGRLIAGTGLVEPDGTTPAFIKLKDGTMTTLLFSYRWQQHLLFSLGINNVLNETFAAGYQNALTIDPSPPRTENFTVQYKY